MPLLHVTDSDVFLMYYHVFTIMSNTMNPFTCEISKFPSLLLSDFIWNVCATNYKYCPDPTEWERCQILLKFYSISQ